jgi:hypothetical protein
VSIDEYLQRILQREVVDTGLCSPVRGVQGTRTKGGAPASCSMRATICGNRGRVKSLSGLSWRVSPRFSSCGRPAAELPRTLA